MCKKKKTSLFVSVFRIGQFQFILVEASMFGWRVRTNNTTKFTHSNIIISHSPRPLLSSPQFVFFVRHILACTGISPQSIDGPLHAPHQCACSFSFDGLASTSHYRASRSVTLLPAPRLCLKQGGEGANGRQVSIATAPDKKFLLLFTRSSPRLCKPNLTFSFSIILLLALLYMSNLAAQTSLSKWQV